MCVLHVVVINTLFHVIFCLGIDVSVADDSVICFKLTAHVICGSFDLPARALVQNFNQFNGSYGCNFCEQPGESFQTQKGGTVRVFPYDRISPTGPSTTSDECAKHARQAVAEHKVVSYLFYTSITAHELITQCVASTCIC